MKLVKMSLAAAVLLGASAFAIDNVKVSGDAKLYYSTNDAGNASLFDKGADLNSPFSNTGGSMGNAALRIGATGDLAKGISFGVTGYALSTLGLENNLVGNVWAGAGTATPHAGADFGGGVQVNDEAWIGEMWIAATLGKTTAKIGRMELDTPLAFTEKWNIVPNTFEAAVLLNQDLPDTTLVGAWVGKTNGYGAGALTVNAGSPFDTFATDGAYAAAVVNNSFKPATVQAWYYNVVNVADAYWLQADINCQLVKGLTIGGQYANLSPKNIGLTLATEDSKAWAAKLGYTVGALNVSAAYSDVAEKDALNVANVATGLTSQSKLYTEAWWNYGYVGVAGAETVNVTAEYDAGVAKVGAYYTNAKNDFQNNDMTEFTVTATKAFGPLDATLAYVSTDADDQNNGSQYNTVQAYLTLKF